MSASPGPAHPLSVVELVPRAPSAEATTERWLDGSSEAIVHLRERVLAIGEEGFATSVVCGAAGSGRMRVARALHAVSPRAAASLAVVDMTEPDASQAVGAIVETLRRTADSPPGNVVLRSVEFADAPTIAAAVELLPAPGNAVECGLIVSTAEPLAALRARSLGHGQLFAHAGRAVLQVPPLSARSADIPVLAKQFLRASVRRFQRPTRGISPRAMSLLQRHPFPGNIRELAGMIEQAILSSSSDWLTAEDLPRLAAMHEPATRRGELVIRMPGNSLREIELQALRLALELTGGRIVRAAELLGITRHALRRKLEKHGLNELRRSAQPPTDPDGDAFI